MCKDNEIFKNQPAILAWEVRLVDGVFCLTIVKGGCKSYLIIIPNSSNNPETGRI